MQRMKLKVKNHKYTQGKFHNTGMNIKLGPIQICLKSATAQLHRHPPHLPGSSLTCNLYYITMLCTCAQKAHTRHYHQPLTRQTLLRSHLSSLAPPLSLAALELSLKTTGGKKNQVTIKLYLK